MKLWPFGKAKTTPTQNAPLFKDFGIQAPVTVETHAPQACQDPEPIAQAFDAPVHDSTLQHYASPQEGGYEDDPFITVEPEQPPMPVDWSALGPESLTTEPMATHATPHVASLAAAPDEPPMPNIASIDVDVFNVLSGSALFSGDTTEPSQTCTSDEPETDPSMLMPEIASSDSFELPGLSPYESPVGFSVTADNLDGSTVACSELTDGTEQCVDYAPDLTAFSQDADCQPSAVPCVEDLPPSWASQSYDTVADTQHPQWSADSGQSDNEPDTAYASSAMWSTETSVYDGYLSEAHSLSEDHPLNLAACDDTPYDMTAFSAEDSWTAAIPLPEECAVYPSTEALPGRDSSDCEFGDYGVTACDDPPEETVCKTEDTPVMMEPWTETIPGLSEACQQYDAPPTETLYADVAASSTFDPYDTRHYGGQNLGYGEPVAQSAWAPVERDSIDDLPPTHGLYEHLVQLQADCVMAQSHHTLERVNNLVNRYFATAS